MEITITIDKKSKAITADAEGYKGVGCLTDVDAILQGIGERVSTEAKDEAVEVVNVGRVKK